MSDYPPEPVMDPPHRCEWYGPWRRVDMWHTGKPSGWTEGGWQREALELDGHEECCHHVLYVTVRDSEWVPR